VSHAHPETAAEHKAEVADLHLLIMEHLDLGGTSAYAMTVVEPLLVELAEEASRTGYMSALSALAGELL
jgi:hypothetical protein